MLLVLSFHFRPLRTTTPISIKLSTTSRDSPTPMHGRVKFGIHGVCVMIMEQLVFRQHAASIYGLELHMINIIYAALPMREQTEKTTFSCKDD